MLSKTSPLHNESVGHLLYGVVLCVQQLLGSLLTYTVQPGLVQLSHTCVIFWCSGEICFVELLNFLKKLLLVLTR